MENNDIALQEYDLSLRPKRLNEYIGQAAVKEMLNVFITSALARAETLDHVLLYGPPGLGKTTLAHIIANEMNAQIYSVAAPSLDRVGDLVAILTKLNAGDFLFIDEIHRLPRIIEEVLYSAMEDYVVNVVVGKDATANTIKIVLPPFTLVGATTRCGDLTAPLRDRFGIVHQINYYPPEEIAEIIKRTSRVFAFDIDEDAAWEIAKRSRGTPRIANRLFRRVRDFAQFDDPDCQKITWPVTTAALTKLNIDEAGLNETDYRYLMTIIEKFGGGPVGLNALGSAISEDLTTLEDVYEPYLIQEGFIVRTPRGRLATKKAYEHLGIEYAHRLF